MSPKTIIFDFDGTIADTLDVAIKIYNDLAPKFNCQTIKTEDKEIFRHKKPQELFKVLDISWFKLPFLLFKIKKELRKQINNTKPIKNISESLKSIKTAGFNLGILTSNNKENVTAFLVKNNLIDLFDFIYTGRNLFGKHKIMARLLKDKKLKPDSIIYVGDETRDIEATKKVEIPIIAVSWGFNSREALAASGPDGIVDEPGKLLEGLGKV